MARISLGYDQKAICIIPDSAKELDKIRNVLNNWKNSGVYAYVTEVEAAPINFFSVWEGP